MKLEFSQSIVDGEIDFNGVGSWWAQISIYLPIREAGKIRKIGLKSEKVYTRLNLPGEIRQLRFLSCEGDGSIEQNIKDDKSY